MDKCSCSDGYYRNEAKCEKCSNKCLTCLTATTCETCSDSGNRNKQDSCNCVDGFYDSGAKNCQPCADSCATCSSFDECLSCNQREFRIKKENTSVCICEDGYYELVHESGSRTCEPCSGECATCVTSPNNCESCNADIARVLGYDSLNHYTCICKAGTYVRDLDSFSCVQSNC